MDSLPEKPPPTALTGLDESLQSIHEALAGMQFGTVLVTVHDGRVVQIDVTEKKRLKPR